MVVYNNANLNQMNLFIIGTYAERWSIMITLFSYNRKYKINFERLQLIFDMFNVILPFLY